MDGESAEIRTRIGAIEIEYEGKASFLQDELLDLVQNGLVSMQNIAAIPVVAPLDEAKTPVPAAHLPILDRSTNTIAGRLGASAPNSPWRAGLALHGRTSTEIDAQ